MAERKEEHEENEHFHLFERDRGGRAKLNQCEKVFNFIYVDFLLRPRDKIGGVWWV